MDQQKFNSIVKMFKEAKDNQNKPLRMNHLLIKSKHDIFHHDFTGTNSKSDIRSISKTVMTIVLGVVIKQSQAGKLPKINEDTLIYPIINNTIDLENKQNEKKLRKIKIKHLLTHTIGYEDVLLMRDDIRRMDPFEYVNYVVNYPIVHEPGEYYLYSNAGFYLLSVVLQEFLQEDLLSFIEREVFTPLGIADYKWEMYGNYVAGATRLWLHPEYLLPFGELLLHNGVIDGKQLISKEWIDKMLQIRNYTASVDTPNATFRRYGYGYGIWLSKDFFYFGHGTDGQILTVLPEQDRIIITLSEQPDIKPIENIINKVIEMNYNYRS